MGTSSSIFNNLTKGVGNDKAIFTIKIINDLNKQSQRKHV